MFKNLLIFIKYFRLFSTNSIKNKTFSSMDIPLKLYSKSYQIYNNNPCKDTL